jgi:hypothetical protein
MTVTLTGARRGMLVSLAIATSLLLPGAASANANYSPTGAEQAKPSSDSITVEVVAVNGSGCPDGTATVSAAADNTHFRVRFSNYVAKVGPAAKPTDFRKNCQLAVRVHYPQGYTFAIAKAEYRGRITLRNGADALQRANYYFQGSSENSPSENEFYGPHYGKWATADVTPVEKLVFAPCGETRNLNINTELRVHEGSANPNSTSWMSMTSATGDVDTLFHFAWKVCK